MNAHRTVLIRRTAGAIVAIVMTACLAATMVAHPAVIKGTVVSASPTSLKVRVIDEATKKATTKDFELDKETKILRGDVVVTFAQARIQANENVAVTVNLDNGDDLADVVRLAARK